MIFAPGVKMNQIRKELFTRSRLSFDKNGCLCVGHTQRQFNGPADGGSLSDDPVFAIALVKRTTKMHDFRRQLIALECRTYLVSNSFNQSHLMVLETFASLTPNESQQSKSLTSNAHGRY